MLCLTPDNSKVIWPLTINNQGIVTLILRLGFSLGQVGYVHLSFYVGFHFLHALVIIAALIIVSRVECSKLNLVCSWLIMDWEAIQAGVFVFPMAVYVLNVP